MTRTLVLLLAFALLPQDQKPTRNAWAGATDGSWVLIETTESAGEDTSKKRHRFKVENQPGGKVVCHVSEEKDKPAIFFEERTMATGQGVEEGAARVGKPRSEPVEIGGRKIACEAVAYSPTDANARLKQVRTVWTTKDVKVPYREWNESELSVTPGKINHSDGPGVALDSNIVRYEDTFGLLDVSGIHRFRVVEFDHKLKVGAREIACVVEEGTIEEKTSEGTTNVTFKRWLSDAVPGKVVRSEMRGWVLVQRVERVRQVIDFEVKK